MYSNNLDTALKKLVAIKLDKELEVRFEIINIADK